MYAYARPPPDRNPGTPGAREHGSTGAREHGSTGARELAASRSREQTRRSVETPGDTPRRRSEQADMATLQTSKQRARVRRTRTAMRLAPVPLLMVASMGWSVLAGDWGHITPPASGDQPWSGHANDNLVHLDVDELDDDLVHIDCPARHHPIDRPTGNLAAADRPTHSGHRPSHRKPPHQRHHRRRPANHPSPPDTRRSSTAATAHGPRPSRSPAPQAHAQPRQRRSPSARRSKPSRSPPPPPAHPPCTTRPDRRRPSPCPQGSTGLQRHPPGNRPAVRIGQQPNRKGPKWPTETTSN
jgi:hypothetical protein